MGIPSKRALFAISSLGLGHATRSLAIIGRYLDKGWHITIVSSGGALEMLRRELAGRPTVSFIEMADYPPLERGTGWRMYWFLLVDLIATRRLIGWEHRQLKKLEAGVEFVFSDGRYGFFSRSVPCFILTHQTAFMPPPLLKRAFRLSRHLNLLALRKFDMILIPDFPSAGRNLGGMLSHSPLLARYRHRYVGILSSYRRQECRQDIDYLFVISGYLLEHKQTFVNTLLAQASCLAGKKVFILGQRHEPVLPPDIAEDDDITVYSMVDGEMRQELFNRSRMIIGRAGYTTIMDLVEHDKPGLLIPTPNQTEQEYLADYMNRCGYFTTAAQHRMMNLQEAAAASRQNALFKPPWRTGQSVQRVSDCIEQLVRPAFISIVVPAHNEESELPETIGKLLEQKYPPDRYEIILVENGSADSTLLVARQLAVQSKGRNISVLQCGKSVSRAKNLGLVHCSPESDWVVFCDADTHLGPYFLRHLNTELNRASTPVSVGTCRIRPRTPHCRMESIWFTFYDCLHRLTKTSYALQIARTRVARSVGFRTDLELAEDLLFIKGCLKHGRFFFLSTDQASTSTRRFNSVGYLRLGMFWLVGALLPMRLKSRLKYHVIR